MPNEPAKPPVTVERVERALTVLAYLIELDGDVHLPLYEKFETELEELRSRQDTRTRARQRLTTYAAAAVPGSASSLLVGPGLAVGPQSATKAR